MFLACSLRESTLVCRRQILTYQVGLRTERVHLIIHLILRALFSFR